MEKTDFPIVISLTHSFFCYLLFSWLLFLSHWKLTLFFHSLFRGEFCQPGSAGVSLPAGSPSPLRWEEAELCPSLQTGLSTAFYKGSAASSIRLSALSPAQQSSYLLWGCSCTLGWSLPWAVGKGARLLLPVDKFGANTVGPKSHYFCLPPTPVCVILLLCCKAVSFITSTTISLASPCITIIIITRVEQHNNIQHVAPQDFYPQMWIPDSTEILIDFNRFFRILSLVIFIKSLQNSRQPKEKNSVKFCSFKWTYTGIKSVQNSKRLGQKYSAFLGYLALASIAARMFSDVLLC